MIRDIQFNRNKIIQMYIITGKLNPTTIYDFNQFLIGTVHAQYV